MKERYNIMIAVSMAVLIALTACVPPRAIDNRFPCAKNEAEILKEIDKIMKEESFIISEKKQAADNTYHYYYSTGPIWEGVTNVTRTWEFWYNPSEQVIYTIPRSIVGEYVFVESDETNKALYYYWNVRKKLEKFCPCTATSTYFNPPKPQ